MVRFAEEDRRLARITATVETNDSVLWMYPDNYDASHLPLGWATFVRNLDVRDASGAVVRTTPGQNRWQLPTGTRGPLRLSYEVLIHHDEGRWPVGEDEAAYANRRCDCVFFTGMAVFIGARDLGRTTVEFDLPKRPGSRFGPWTSVTPWVRVEGRPNTYRTESFRTLSEVALLVGNMPTTEVAVGDASVIVASGRDLENGVTLVGGAVRDYLAGAQRVFASPAKGSFVVIANKGVFDGGGAFISSVSMLFRDSLAAATRGGWGQLVAHELTHLWNGMALRYAPTGEWFVEGVTEYLARRIQLGAGDFVTDTLLSRVTRDWYSYYLSEAGKGSLEDAGLDKQNLSGIVYGGGFTMGLILDIELRRASGGERGIEDLAKELFRRHGTGADPVSLADLGSAVNQVAGRSVFEPLRQMIVGEDPLPLERYLSAIGYAVRVQRAGEQTTVTILPDPAATAATQVLRVAVFGAS